MQLSAVKSPAEFFGGAINATTGHPDTANNLIQALASIGFECVVNAILLDFLHASGFRDRCAEMALTLRASEDVSCVRWAGTVQRSGRHVQSRIGRSVSSSVNPAARNP